MDSPQRTPGASHQVARTDVVELIVTGPVEWLPAFVADLVTEWLIACGQCARVDSVYRWQDQIEHDEEIRAHLHTTADQTERV